jgi:hypothetical protein
MPLRRAKALTFRPKTVTDAVDSTNAEPGSLMAAADLIWSMHTRSVLVPRPAAYVLSPTPATGELLQTIGTQIYGFMPSSRFPGHSEPFLIDEATGIPVPIQGVTAANTPMTAPTAGDWTPPTFTAVGAYRLFTHPGFALPNAFGWLDMTGFADSTTGDLTASSTQIINLGKDVNSDGWRAGQVINDSAGLIPAGTRIASIALDGLSLTLTQAAVGAAVGDTFSVLGGTPSYPLWAAGNTSINPLPAVPAAVSQFNGRAYFAVASGIPFTDDLDPLIRTNASQALTFDNGVDVTAFGTIPFNTTAGGIIQSLLVFQGDTAIQQITGDPATSNLSKNLLSEIGTLAPNAIVSTPVGVVFVAPDGLRVVQKDGTVSPPIGADGDGVALPFINAVFPSRMCASYNEDVIRISATYNDSIGGSVVSQEVSAEWWFHIKLKAWSGPHSFPAAQIAPLDGPRTRHGHVMFALNAPGLWFSNTRPMIDSSYTENGVPLTGTYRTSLLPDNELMFMNGMNETTVMISLPPGETAQVLAVDDKRSLLDSVAITGATPPAGVWGQMVWGVNQWGGPKPAAGIWGTMVWGQSTWGDSGAGGALLAQRLVPWDREVVFKQVSISIAAPSSPAVAIGNLYMRYQITGYTLQDLA